jgi:hypothetical protein
MTFLHKIGEKTFRAKVKKTVIITDDDDDDDDEEVKFVLKVGGDGREGLMPYNELSDLIERQHEAEANGDNVSFAFK